MKFLLLVFLFLISNCFCQKPEVVLTTGHTSSISSIVVSSDGRYIVTSSIDKTFKILETNSGKELRTVSGFNQRVEKVKLSPDNQYLAACIEGESIEIYKFPSCEKIASVLTSTSEFDFLTNSTELIYIDSDSKLVVFDLLKKEVIKTSKEEIFVRFCLNPGDNKSLVAYDYKGNFHAVDIETMNSTLKVAYFSEFKYITTEIEISPSGKILDFPIDEGGNGKNGTIHLLNPLNFKLIKKFESKESRVFDLAFDKKEDILLACEHNGNVIQIDCKKQEEIARHKSTVFSASTLCTHPFERFYLLPEMNGIHFIDRETGKKIKTLESRINRIINMAYDQKGKYLVSSTSDIKLKVWDLQLNKIDHSLQGFFPVAFAPNGSYFVSMLNASQFAFWDPISGEKIDVLDCGGELIQNISFNKEGTLLSGGGFMGIVHVWDLKTKKEIYRLKGHVGGIYGTSFSPDGKFIASCGMDNTIRIWDLSSGEEVKQLKQHEILSSDIKFSPDGKLLACSSWDKTISIWNTNDWTLKNVLKGHTNMITSIDFNHESTILASAAGNNSVFKADNSVITWDLKTGNLLCKFENHQGAVNKVILDQNKSLAYSTGNDGTIKIWDYLICDEIASLISVAKDDYIILTPDNYYLASKNALKAVSFRIKDDIYPFEQFDLKLNRPDIICQRIGHSPENLVKAYRYVYKKRITKAGFDEAQLESDFDLPKVEITNKKSVPVLTNLRKLELELEFFTKNSSIKKINIYNNGVPQFDFNGLTLSKNETNNFSKKIEIELIPGQNNFQFSAINEKGVESLKSSISIFCNTEDKKGDLYVISIGAGKFIDKRFDLKYPAKDALDFQKSMLENKDLYNQIKLKSLLEEEVNIVNFKELNAFVSQAKREDVLLIFVAGHGLLDEDFNYFFATHDMNFEKPEEKGISYEMLELLLSSSKANKKMLLMDTCHSGELDKEEIEKSKSSKSKIEDIQFRAVGENIDEKSTFGYENTVVLTQRLFTDFGNETGATIISSSGGAEFSMESEQWKNGLFTYCLLEGLKSLNADQNSDKNISVSEIRNYVYQQVSSLSQGRQKPSSRAENIQLDFRVW